MTKEEDMKRDEGERPPGWSRGFKDPDEAAMTDRVSPEELRVEAESSHTPADVAGVLLRAAQHITRLEGENERLRGVLALVRAAPEHAVRYIDAALSHSAPKEGM